ncbi:MAG TPA: hypothetical protein VF988_12845, partial [Verrucomicrobiae bacterium]
YLPPPPRRVRGGPGGGIWFGRIFMLPHTLIGIGAAGYLLFLLFLILFSIRMRVAPWSLRLKFGTPGFGN